MIRTPINNGLLQSDLDCDEFDLLNSSSVGGGGAKFYTVNVKDPPYNATGDGVTDDSAAIQSALDAVAALGGGRVFFPRGTYLCNGDFDPDTNSILKIPFNSNDSAIGGNLRTIALLGETQPQGAGAIIKSTKTGTGTVPSILAAGPYAGTGILSDFQFNFTETYLQNLTFRVPDDPSIGAVRLDVAIRAHLEDVWVQAGSMGTQPTHGTVGVWMPNSQNGAGVISCDRVFSGGFDTAFRVGEHFRSSNIFAFRCITGIEFLPANFPSLVDILLYQCVSDIRFSGHHSVQVFLDTEHARSDAGWMAPGIAIVDPSNFGRGDIRYQIDETYTGAIPGPITISGGAYLSLTDFETGITTIAPSGKLTGTGTVPPGGTTGQVLKKLSNADYDVAWG
jgi:hypothetical protein